MVTRENKNTRESVFKNSLSRKLQATECNALILSFAGSTFQKRGIPDWFVGHRIWSGWLELKAGTNPYSVHQLGYLTKLYNRGVPAFGLRFIDGVIYLQDRTGKTLDRYTLTNGNEFLHWLRMNSDRERTSQKLFV